MTTVPWPLCRDHEYLELEIRSYYIVTSDHYKRKKSSKI